MTLSGIPHEDYVDNTLINSNETATFPYWNDGENVIFMIDKGDKIRRQYTLHDIERAPIVPIQLINKT